MIFSQESGMGIKKAGFILLLIFIGGAFLFVTLPYFWGKNRINPRVYIGNTILRGNIENAKEKISEECKNYQNKPISLIYEGKSYQSSLSEIGFYLDEERTFANLKTTTGPNNSLFNHSFKWWGDLFLGFKVPVYYSFDVTKLNEVLKNKFKIILYPAEEAKFKFENENIIISPSKNGIGVDGMFFVAEVLENLKKWSSDPIKINLVKIDPDISTVQAESMKGDLKKMFDYPFSFKVKNYNFNLPKPIILSWIEIQKNQSQEDLMFGNQSEDVKDLSNLILASQDFSEYKKKYVLTFDINRSAVEAFLKGEVESLIYQKPENGILALENGEIKEIKPSSPEITIDMEKSIDMIIDALKNNNYFINLPVQEKPADVSIGKIKELGIGALLATGDSNFVGSPTNRRHNIAVGASKFNGVVIDKGAEFSFITTLGPVDKDTGYLPELVIKVDKTIPEYGGGMCQVSSTCFRGAVKAGLQVTERQNHAYPVQYYSPQGTDATVYIPKPDLKFVNNTPGPILLQTRMEGNNLYFDFFGNSDQRKVELEGPTTFDKKPDGSLKAEWIQKVYDKNNNLMFQKNFLSKYDSPSKYPHPGDEKSPKDSKKKKKKGGT